MSTTTELMDLARSATASSSDAELARKVGLKPAALSNYRQGTRHADEETIDALCKAAKLKPARWAMMIQADRQKSESARRFWMKLAQAAAMVALTLSFGRPNVHAETPTSASVSAHNPGHVYIMSNA
jgi:transcriptional regulator with XRE-family HTH domain